jgi:hypothetical protein
MDPIYATALKPFIPKRLSKNPIEDPSKDLLQRPPRTPPKDPQIPLKSPLPPSVLEQCGNYPQGFHMPAFTSCTAHCGLHAAPTPPHPTPPPPHPTPK